MNKPIIPAIAAGIGWPIGELAASNFDDREPAWFFALSVGIGGAFVFYAVTQWKQKKANSSSEPSDS